MNANNSELTDVAKETIQLASKIILEAIQSRASDIHLEWVNVEIHDFDNDSEDPEIITEYGRSPVKFDEYGFQAARDQMKGILRAKLNCSPDSLAAELTDEIFNALHITPEQGGPF